MLLMPLATLDVIQTSVQEVDADEARNRPDDLWRIQMRRAAAAAPIMMNAVLHRQQLTLAALEALRPGDVLDIPANAPGEIQLTIRQPGGKTATIATGRLGEYRGSKVVKLETPIDPRLCQHVRNAL